MAEVRILSAGAAQVVVERIAVRKGTPLPDISGDETLRGNLLAATRIACPDPASCR